MSPPRRRFSCLVLLWAVAGYGCASSTGTSASSSGRTELTRRFEGRPVSFDYPADWFVFDADASEEEGADGPPGPSSRALVGLDQLNRVVVRGAPGEIVVTSDTFDERRAEVEDMVEEGLLATAKILAGPDVITVGMQPALRWRVTTPSSVGYVITTTVVVLFRGARQYTITCSHIPSFAEVIEDGCSKIIASAEFTYQAPL